MKNIVLCSDGTGNKGGYGEDTNVYKTYKAVDIHHSTLEQITFYDQGVGTDKSDTNKNKYTTALSGAFGFGFAANVRHLYYFLAKSYQPGDSIFLFGFSRGAATVRAFAGFINACGLLDKNHERFKLKNGAFNEDEFRIAIDEAFSCYESSDQTLRDDFKNRYAVKHANYAPNGNLKIKFLGVWDTVSALGFPKDFSFVIEKLFTFLDTVSDKIFPHHFYNYELNPCIEHAYHAVSIDDERQTFHPMVWDENSFTGHVEQVWFSGVHSNVGGGYPRTGMSSVAMEWMITKAEKHGLVYIADRKREIQQDANIYDKLYDSRDGIAVYYRYGPRDLTKLCEGKLKGKIVVHEKTYTKLKHAVDGYAPDGLPSEFNVVNDKGALSRSVKVDDANLPKWNSLQLEANKLIDNRKRLYRVFVELTMLIIAASYFLWIGDTLSCEPGSLLDKVAGVLKYFTPVFFENFITFVVCKNPVIFPAMLATLYVMNRFRVKFTNELGNICRQLKELLP